MPKNKLDLNFAFIKTRRKILKFLNFFWFIKPLKDKKFIIPILGGVGSINLHYRRDWMFFILSRLISMKSGSFLDVGANLGQTLITFKDTNNHGTYFGFEPNPLCVSYLSELVKANNFLNCFVIPVGLSNTNQLAKLYYPDDVRSPGASISEHIRSSVNNHSSIVATFKLDEVVNHLNIEDIHIIKIDVEGLESEVLEGMSETLQKFRPFIICEVLFRDPQMDAQTKKDLDSRIFNVLHKHKYLAFQINKTSDLKSVQELIYIEQFQQVTWNPSNKDLCDYLFIPCEYNNSDLIRSLIKPIY